MASSELAPLETLILEMRGQKVMLDSDLARIYGVETRVLKQAARRNRRKFPPDFMFELTPEESRELQRLRSQIVILKQGQHLKYPPYAFTEHGAIMAATVLNSPRAVQMTVFVVRAFLKMRAMLTDTHELARKLAALEKELKERLDVHQAAIVGILQRIMNVIAPRPLPEPEREKIGFRVGEPGARYGVRQHKRHG